jgi:hypothetical protein
VGRVDAAELELLKKSGQVEKNLRPGQTLAWKFFLETLNIFYLKFNLFTYSMLGSWIAFSRLTIWSAFAIPYCT